MIPRQVKRLGLAVANAVNIPAVTRRLLRDRGLIFMLHRFRDPELGVEGQDPHRLRRGLEYLRRHRYELVSLMDLLDRLSTRSRPTRGAIAFTFDDGYQDQTTIGAGIFSEFDCPVTTFVTTGFVDGSLWFWWDQIQYVFSQTRARHLRVPVADGFVEYRWSDEKGRERACQDFTNRCKTISQEPKEQALHDLASAAGIDVPARAPSAFAPVSWQELRACETRGMTFGPHTVTHPVLSRTNDRQSEEEIVQSWRRLREQASAPVPVFCYPNGQSGDYGRREYDTLKKAGLVGSVVGTPGYAHVDIFKNDDYSRFQIPRYAWPDDVQLVAQYASGLERIKQWVVGRARDSGRS